jgi:hypothetical protein
MNVLGYIQQSLSSGGIQASSGDGNTTSTYSNLTGQGVTPECD